MNKIEEAQLVLKELGLPSQQQNKICALTLLALAGIKENSKWSSATKKSLTLSKDIIQFVNREYKQDYKPNTRESFRKIALHPFVKHDIAVLNPDNPSLTPSSSKTHYSLTDSAYNTIKTFKTARWKNHLKLFKYLQQQKKTLEIKNFKSIKNVKLNFSRINILIGKPNSGKSNFLEALTLFNYIKGRQNRSNELGLIRYNTLDNLFFDRDLEKEIIIKFNDNIVSFTYQSGINNFVQVINPSPEYLDIGLALFKSNLSLNEIQKQAPFLSKDLDLDSYSSKYAILGKEGNFIQNGETSDKENPIRRYEFRDGLSYNELFGGYLKSNGENLFTIVQSNDDLREWINSFFEEYKLEFLIDFSSRLFEIQKKENRIVYKIPFELTPDTFRRMLFHVAAIYSSKDTTILFEEPESHSFPPYIKELSELIKADDNNNTYFITTHSPYFFNSMIEDSEKMNDISFFHVYYEDYQTKIKKLTGKELNNVWGSGADVFFNIDSLKK
jgi:AAA15 family ATPase/GTPase